VPVEETAATLRKLYDQGKIRAIGVSTILLKKWRVRNDCAVAHRSTAYNLFEREIERDVLPYALGHDITHAHVWSALRGLLSGAMHADRQFFER